MDKKIDEGEVDSKMDSSGRIVFHATLSDRPRCDSESSGLELWVTALRPARGEVGNGNLSLHFTVPHADRLQLPEDLPTLIKLFGHAVISAGMGKGVGLISADAKDECLAVVDETEEVLALKRESES